MFHIAIVCASNQNRSMEAHCLLKKNKFSVCSYGTNTMVRLPGKTSDSPNVYSFDMLYKEMYTDLKEKDISYYKQNGLLSMLERNMKIKDRPERFQESKKKHDLIITCDEKCFDIIHTYLLQNITEDINTKSPVYLVNFDIKDTHVDASSGAKKILEFCKKTKKVKCLGSLIEEFIELEKDIQMLYTVCLQ